MADESGVDRATINGDDVMNIGGQSSSEANGVLIRTILIRHTLIRAVLIRVSLIRTEACDMAMAHASCLN